MMHMIGGVDGNGNNWPTSSIYRCPFICLGHNTCEQRHPNLGKGVSIYRHRRNWEKHLQISHNASDGNTPPFENQSQLQGRFLKEKNNICKSTINFV